MYPAASLFNVNELNDGFSIARPSVIAAGWHSKKRAHAPIAALLCPSLHSLRCEICRLLDKQRPLCGGGGYTRVFAPALITPPTTL